MRVRIYRRAAREERALRPSSRAAPERGVRRGPGAHARESWGRGAGDAPHQIAGGPAERAGRSLSLSTAPKAVSPRVGARRGPSGRSADLAQLTQKMPGHGKPSRVGTRWVSRAHEMLHPPRTRALARRRRAGQALGGAHLPLGRRVDGQQGVRGGDRTVCKTFKGQNQLASGWGAEKVGRTGPLGGSGWRRSPHPKEGALPRGNLLSLDLRLVPPPSCRQGCSSLRPPLPVPGHPCLVPGPGQPLLGAGARVRGS